MDAPATPPPDHLTHRQLMALAKASRPWYAEKRFWALGLVAFFVTMTALGASKTPASSENVGGVRTLSVNGANPPQADVTLTSCSIGEYGLPSVKILITNRSSGRSNYIVSVNLLDAAGTKIGEGFASSNNVEAGQSAVDDVAAMVSAGTLARCVVTEVNRFASR